jgi:hypothetical protein
VHAHTHICNNLESNHCAELFKQYAIKTYWRMDVEMYTFLTLALVGSKGLALCSGSFTPGKSPWHPLDRRMGGFQGLSGENS